MKTAWMALIALGLLVTSTFANVTKADEADWKKKYPNYTLVSEEKIDLEKGKDSVEVGGDGRYTGLLFILENKLEMYDVKVKYQNGQEYDPQVRHSFKEGALTKQFDLPGEARAIREVSFYYSGGEKKGGANVKLCGCQTGATEASITKMPATQEGYYFLGSNDISLSADRDSISIGDQPTRFVTLMLGVPDTDLEFWDIKLTYESGDTHTPNLRLKFDATHRARFVEVPRGLDNPDGRRVTKVGFNYKGTRTDGKTKVKLYGRPAVAEKRFANHKLIGTREIDLSKASDSIAVGREAGKFKSLLIEVENADLSFTETRITYGNGTEFKLGSQLDFDESWRNRKADFNDKEDHSVDKITFNYTAKGKKEGKAVVNLYGKDKD